MHFSVNLIKHKLKMHKTVVLSADNIKRCYPADVYAKLNEEFEGNRNLPVKPLAVLINSALMRGDTITISTYQERTASTAYKVTYKNDACSYICRMNDNQVIEPGRSIADYLNMSFDDELLVQY